MFNKKSICFVEEAMSKYPNERNNGGLWLACQLRDQGFSEADAEPVMLDYANSVDPNGYGESNALASLRQAFKRPAREAREANPLWNGNHSALAMTSFQFVHCLDASG